MTAITQTFDTIRNYPFILNDKDMGSAFNPSLFDRVKLYFLLLKGIKHVGDLCNILYKHNDKAPFMLQYESKNRLLDMFKLSADVYRQNGYYYLQSKIVKLRDKYEDFLEMAALLSDTELIEKYLTSAREMLD